MKIFLTRHGETKESKQRIILDNLPGALSAKGKKDTLKIANFFKKNKNNS